MPISSSWAQEVRPIQGSAITRLNSTGQLERLNICCCLVSQEDDLLRDLVAEHGPKKWSLIASQLGTKGSKQVGHGGDIVSAVCISPSAAKTGAGPGTSLPFLRLPQWRRRWKNYLTADLKKGGWSREVSRAARQGKRGGRGACPSSGSMLSGLVWNTQPCMSRRHADACMASQPDLDCASSHLT